MNQTDKLQRRQIPNTSVVNSRFVVGGAYLYVYTRIIHELVSDAIVLISNKNDHSYVG